MNQYDTHAELYDQLYLGLPGEQEFYASESLKYPGPVLEIGCGTGRITIPVAQVGVDITGIDISDGLLKVAREKVEKIKVIPGNIELVYADMRDFSFDKKSIADAANPTVQRWEELMWQYQQALPSAKPGEKWLLMDKIFDLNSNS